MKIKKLHIRNIASIESADIDFENGLNDPVTGEPAPIFLISGDTGTGKSVILDSIAMALYKTTPRIKGVVNLKENEYTNNEGETINISSIEQYTRLGISPNDPSYSEVVFEGNDHKTYHARLTLGISKSKTKNVEGNHMLKYKGPKWEIKVDGGDWTKGDLKTIQQAVGLDFQQFGRMAMLAQGQFANFLTGDKKEREAILEQLTNTQHFSRYGEAINNLYKKAKNAIAPIQAQYETEKQHTLSEEDVTRLTQEQEGYESQKTELESRIKDCENRLKQVETVLNSEKAQGEAQAKKQELERVIDGDEYQRNKALYTDWDATTNERQALVNQQQARHEEDNAKEALKQSQEKFEELISDMAFRQKEAEALCHTIQQNMEWIDARQQHENLFSKSGETDLKIGQYLKNTEKAAEYAKNIAYERNETEGLKIAETEAIKAAEEARKDVEDKETEIKELNRKRDELDPQGTNERLEKKKATKKTLEDILNAQKTLEKDLKKENNLRDEIKNEEEELAKLKIASERAEAVYQEKKKESEKADRRLNTMEMSVEKTIVELRHQMHIEHTDTCPLCGQHINPDHLTDDFKEVLSPLETEKQQAANALIQATRQRDDAKEAYDIANGIQKGKKIQLEKEKKGNAHAKQALDIKATQAGLNIEESIVEQTSHAISLLDDDINQLKETQKKVEDLQENINKLLKERKPLEDKRVEKEKAKTNAENNVRNNADSIKKLENERKNIINDCESLKAEINDLLSGYCDNWLADTNTIRQQLKKDAKEYSEHKNQYNDDKINLDKIKGQMETLSSYKNNILEYCPQWTTQADAKAYPCRNINSEWTTLLSNVSGNVMKINECEELIDKTGGILRRYYQESGKTEEQLLILIGQEAQVAAARLFVNNTNTQLQSRNDAIIDAQKKIDGALKALNIDNRSELPDNKQLEQNKESDNKERDEINEKIGQTKTQLESHQASIENLKKIEMDLKDAKKDYNRWERLNNYFGGTRLRTLVQTYILRPLLNNANIYLEKITDRYKLTCDEKNDKLSILVLDRYNKNQVRSATILSGGERFMISLALSLALSSLNRPDMNVNILFIDEGFGTLDLHSLDSVMATLEKLQEIAGQSNRRVGVISHREELERITVKIHVKKHGEGRSKVEIATNP